jgi:hypothetical protein
VAERLRNIPQQCIVGRIDFLGQPPNLIGIGNRLLKRFSHVFDLSSQRLCLSKPERTE